MNAQATIRRGPAGCTPHQRLYARTLMRELDLDMRRANSFHAMYWTLAKLTPLEIGTDLDAGMYALSRADASALIGELRRALGKEDGHA